MKVPRTLAIISETLDWFKDQFDSITKIGIRILVEVLKVKQVTKESSFSPFIIIIMIIVIILSVSIMIFVIMFVFGTHYEFGLSCLSHPYPTILLYKKDNNQ